MDELIIDGKKYLSSKRAAHISGYAKDYVGQLCRGKKLDARLVGRSWYVEESSLLAHTKTVLASVAAVIPDVMTPPPSSVTPSRVAHRVLVPEIPQQEFAQEEISEPTPTPIIPQEIIQEPTTIPIHSVHQIQKEVPVHESFVTWDGVKYESETQELIPEIATRERTEISTLAGVRIKKVDPAALPHSILEKRIERTPDSAMQRFSVSIPTPQQKKNTIRRNVSTKLRGAHIIALTAATTLLFSTSLFFEEKISYQDTGLAQKTAYESALPYIQDSLGNTRLLGASIYAAQNITIPGKNFLGKAISNIIEFFKGIFNFYFKIKNQYY